MATKKPRKLQGVPSTTMGIEAIRFEDADIPGMLHNLAGLLVGDEETLIRLGRIAAGRELIDGEQVSFEIDMATIGALVGRVATWADASIREKNEIAEDAAIEIRMSLRELQAERDKKRDPGFARWANDPKTAAKAGVKELFIQWQTSPTWDDDHPNNPRKELRTGAAFARFARDRVTALESEEKISQWIRKWRKEMRTV
jgi:hypothetical protein